MCCVLWDLCVCFLCQDGIYISDVNKRFLKSTVTLCTKCRTKFCLSSLRQRTSVSCWWYCPVWGGWPRMTLHSGSVQWYFEQADLCRAPPSLREGRSPPWKQGSGLWIPPCLLGPLCHMQGLQQSGFCEHCRQSQLGWLRWFWTVPGANPTGSSPLLFLPLFPKWFSDHFC